MQLTRVIKPAPWSKKTWLSLALAAACLYCEKPVFSQESSPSQLQFELTDLGTLGGNSSKVSSLNNHGQVVGQSVTSTGEESAFIWENGKMTAIAAKNAADINDGGEVVGTVADGRDMLGRSQSTAFRWNQVNGVDASILPYLNEGLSPKKLSGFATAINNRGDIAMVGSGIATYAIIKSTDGKNVDLGHFGGMISLAYDINDKGEVVGMSKVGRTTVHAFIYRNSSLVDLGSLGAESGAMGVNNKSEVVGSSKDKLGRLRAFHWADGYMKDIGTLGGKSATARCINEQSVIVGNSVTADSEEHGFLYAAGELVDLNKLVPAANGWTVVDAFKVNDKGQIAANAKRNGITHAVLLTPVSQAHSAGKVIQEPTVKAKPVVTATAASPTRSLDKDRDASSQSSTRPASPAAAQTISSAPNYHAQQAKFPATKIEELPKSAGAPPAGFKAVEVFATTSPDFSRLAFTAENEKKDRMAIIDGKQHPVYLIVNDIIFSPDSQHYAYFAHQRGANGKLLCVDGQTSHVTGINNSLQYSPDSSQLIYVSNSEPVRRQAGGASWYESPASLMVNGKAGPKFGVIFNIKVSQDNSIAFSGMNNGEPTVVLNNKVIGVYTELPDLPFSPAPTFSPDGKRTAYAARRGRGWFAVVDQKEYQQTYEEISYFRFSPDSKRTSWLTRSGKHRVAYVDGQALTQGSDSALDRVTFSPDSKRTAVPAASGESATNYIDGQPQQRYEQVQSATFSHNSARWAFWGKKGDKSVVNCDGLEGPAFDDIGSTVLFSPDDSHIAYTAKRGNQEVLMIDGSEVDRAEEFGQVLFSPSGKALAYWAKQGKLWQVRVNGVRSETAFASIVNARPNTLDFTNYHETQMFFASDAELRVAGQKESQEFVTLSIKIGAGQSK